VRIIKSNNILTTNYTIQTNNIRFANQAQSRAPEFTLSKDKATQHSSLILPSPKIKKPPSSPRFPTLWTTYWQKEPIILGVCFYYHTLSTMYIWIEHTTTCKVVTNHSHWGTSYMFSQHTHNLCINNRAFVEVSQEVQEKPCQLPPC
jgi:hypothetical protein